MNIETTECRTHSQGKIASSRERRPQRGAAGTEDNLMAWPESSFGPKCDHRRSYCRVRGWVMKGVLKESLEKGFANRVLFC